MKRERRYNIPCSYRQCEDMYTPLYTHPLPIPAGWRQTLELALSALDNVHIDGWEAQVIYDLREQAKVGLKSILGVSPQHQDCDESDNIKDIFSKT